MYPSLRADVPLVRRGPTEVQIGLDPDGVVLTGLSPEEAHTLVCLDGSTPLEVLRRESARLVDLVPELTARGLLVDAHHPSPAAGRRVGIDGGGATTRLLADLLREAGARVVHGPAVLDEIDFAGRSGRDSLTGCDLDVLVRITGGAFPPSPLRHDGLPCLPVLVRPRSVVVGPLLHEEGPCLLCLDLARADADPLWGQVLAQVHHVREPETGSPATALAASLACARVLDLLGDGAATIPSAESVEMTLPAGRLTRRRWRRHARCPRHVPASSAAPPG